MSDDFRIRRVQAGEAVQHVDALADLLLDCVEGGASVSFMWPLPRERALAFWAGVAEGVRAGERVLLIGEDAAGRIIGTVQLIVAQPDNQPHRADVAKMLVHRSARRRGLAQRLLVAPARRASRCWCSTPSPAGTPSACMREAAGSRSARSRTTR